MIGHFQDSAQIRRLAFVEIQVRSRRVVIRAINPDKEPERYQRIEKVARRSGIEARVVIRAINPDKEPERYQRIEKVARRSGIEAQAAAQGLQILGGPTQFGEDRKSVV